MQAMKPLVLVQQYLFSNVFHCLPLEGCGFLINSC